MEVFDTLGEYRLGRKLGVGQYSKVREGYRGEDKFAVKYMSKNESTLVTKTCYRLIYNEVKTMVELNHPNLVKLFECSENGVIDKANGKKIPVFYLVLELISNGELFDYVLIGGSFPERMARYYYRQLIETLEYLHSKGFAHRDIKAENVLLDSNYNIKLADFGFAAPMAGKDGSGFLYTSKGTEGYMAPEICSKQPYSGEKIDLFATGVLLFILIAQRNPFRRASVKDEWYVLFCTCNGMFWEKMANYRPPNTFTPDFIELINALLAPNPEHRPNIKTIKASKWYNGEVATAEEIRVEFTLRRAKIEEDWKIKAAEKLKTKQLKVPGFGYNPYAQTKSSMGEDSPASSTTKKLLPAYKPNGNEQTTLFTVEEPEIIIEKLKEYFNEQNFDVKESEKKYKLKVECNIQDEQTIISTKVEAVGEGINCIRVQKIEGNKVDFFTVFKEIRDTFDEAKMLI